MVGAIACRIEKDGEDGPKGKPALLATGNIGGTKVYVMTLGVLPAYRGRGIGAKLVQDVLDAVQNPETEDLQGHELEKIYLHMHTVNTGAQKFYKVRSGSSNVKTRREEEEKEKRRREH